MWWKTKNSGGSVSIANNITSLTNPATSAMISRAGDAAEFYELEIGQVIDIVLSAEHPKYEKNSVQDNIGVAFIRLAESQKNVQDNMLTVAYPLDSTFKKYPTLNELVVVVKYLNVWFYDNVLNYFNRINNNATQILGMPNNTNGKIKYGEVFVDKNATIPKLQPNEGDVILQGRNGQNIRFSNDESNPFVHITVGLDSNNKKSLTVEDINKDSNTILITTSPSKDVVFVPSKNIKVKPPYYANDVKLVGNQIFISTDRIVLNAKQNEILMYANKTISGVSNGSVTFDAKTNFLVDAPEIKLGKQNIEPMVLGNKLVDALTKLIDAIPQLMYYQAHIGGNPGEAKLKQLKAKLQDILSKKNWTQ
ncbi:MAG: hypothetical protein WC401_06140 [Bacteroidales bacterium]|jgi:hypothetical protein